MSLPLRLKRILLSSPPTIDPSRDVPGDYQFFLVAIKQAFTKLWSSQPATLRAAVAPEWKALWDWLRTGLQTARTFENRTKLSEETRNRVMSMIPSLTFVLACILYGMETGSCGDVDEEFKAIIFNVAPDLLEVLAMALMIPFRFQNACHSLQMMTEFADPLLSLDDNTMAEFIKELEHASLRATGETFLVAWQTCICQEFLEGDYRIDGLRLSYFLLFLKFPIGDNLIQLPVVSKLWPQVYKLWQMLISKDARLMEQIQLDCIRQILSCQKDWIAGGFRWVALALDNQMVIMIAKTARFLSRCVHNSEHPNEILGMFPILSELIEGVYVYRMYHCVSYRVERNLKRKVGGRRPKATLRIGYSDQEKAFNAIWGRIWNEFGDCAKVTMRKKRWNEALAHGCVICQRSINQIKALPRPHSCSRCGVSIYCSKKCQRHDYYDHGHKDECVDLAKSVNTHPLHYDGESPRPALPVLEKHYILAWLNDILEELLPHIDPPCNQGKPRVIIFDFLSLKFECEVSDLNDILEEFEPSVQNEIEARVGHVLYCGRVPLSDCTAVLLPLRSVP